MKKWILRAGISLVLVASVFLTARWFVVQQIRAALFDWMITFRKSGAQIHVQDVDVAFWASNINITNLQLLVPDSNSTRGVHVNVQRLVLQGYELIRWLKSGELLIHSVSVTAPAIRYTSLRQTTRGSPEEGALKKLTIEKWAIVSGTITCLDSTSGETRWHAGTNIEGRNLVWSRSGSTGGRTQLEDVQLTRAFLQQGDTYLITAKSIAYNQAFRRIRADSIGLQPLGTHNQFVRKVGHQTDEISGWIPWLTLEGFDPPDSVMGWHPRSVNLGFTLNIYRDLRYPDVKAPPHMMPIPLLHSLPFRFHVDSINLRAGDITYEEVPASDTPSGSVSFNALKATILNLSNDSTGEVIMDAQCKFMNRGDLNVHFTFPQTAGRLYDVKGSLGKFPLTAINQITRSSANLQVNSGTLNELQFYFRYNGYRSDGELTINYNDLRFVSLRADEKQSTRKVTSWLLGIIMDRNNDYTHSRARRTGYIHWERDPQSGLPSYWWKSILSGLKEVLKPDSRVSKKWKEKKGK